MDKSQTPINAVDLTHFTSMSFISISMYVFNVFNTFNYSTYLGFNGLFLALLLLIENNQKEMLDYKILPFSSIEMSVYGWLSPLCLAENLGIRGLPMHCKFLLCMDGCNSVSNPGSRFQGGYF